MGVVGHDATVTSAGEAGLSLCISPENLSVLYQGARAVEWRIVSFLHYGADRHLSLSTEGTWAHGPMGGYAFPDVD